MFFKPDSWQHKNKKAYNCCKFTNATKFYIHYLTNSDTLAFGISLCFALLFVYSLWKCLSSIEGKNTFEYFQNQFDIEVDTLRCS